MACDADMIEQNNAADHNKVLLDRLEPDLDPQLHQLQEDIRTYLAIYQQIRPSFGCFS